MTAPMSDPELERTPMTNDSERVSDIVAVEAVERIWDFLAPLREREKGMEISAVFIARMKELEASDQSARDLLNEQDDIIEAQSKALAEAREVKVLEWRIVGEGWQAESPIGWFSILPGVEVDFEADLYFNGKSVRSFATEDEAKAAAQADYSARILSALRTPTPENPNG